MSTTVSPELKSALKRLRLGKLLDTLPERIAIAQKDGTSIEDLVV